MLRIASMASFQLRCSYSVPHSCLLAPASFHLPFRISFLCSSCSSMGPQAGDPHSLHSCLLLTIMTAIPSSAGFDSPQVRSRCFLLRCHPQQCLQRRRSRLGNARDQQRNSTPSCPNGTPSSPNGTPSSPNFTGCPCSSCIGQTVFAV
jgi:hypothetical protein